ncbi:MAG: DUF2807 domain-containing protein [Duncaniella sp.]|nr:DUF2807 domain-containing protein [Duncaniella sp.]
MLRFITFLAASAAMIAASAQSLSTYSVKVGDFDKLFVKGNINVNYISNPDTTGIAVFDAPESIVSGIMFQNKSGKLTVKISDELKDVADLPTVNVYSAFLVKAENSGDSTLRLEKVQPVPDIKLNVVNNGRIVCRDLRAHRVEAALSTGHGEVVLFGKCDEAVYNFVGTGLLQCDELEARAVTVKAFGTGQVGCWATESLKIYGGGSTTIYYKGSPAEITDRGVGIKLRKIDE